MRRPHARPWLAFTLLLLAGAAHAELADRDKEIVIRADQAGMNEKTGEHVLTGRVHITQGTMVVDADRANQLNRSDGSQLVRAEGRPVKFRQKMEGQNTWLDAHGDRVDYDSKSGDVKLSGNAWLKRGEDEFTGSTIVYNTNTEVYHAEGGPHAPAATGDAPQGQVKIVIQPKKKTETPAKP